MKITRAVYHPLIAVCSLWRANAAVGVEQFNGKDFTGWTFFEHGNTDPANTWSVSDGLIH